jgi:hypothetical protein
VGFGCFILSIAFSDHFSNGRMDFLQWSIVICGDKLPGLKVEPYVLVGVSSMLRLKVAFCFLLLIGQLDGQLAVFVVWRRAGFGHIMVVFLYR